MEGAAGGAGVGRGGHGGGDGARGGHGGGDGARGGHGGRGRSGRWGSPALPPASPRRVTGRVRTGGDRQPGVGFDAGAELALAGVTVAAVVSLVRLFSDTGFLGPVVAAAVASHAVASVTRRMGWKGLPAALASAGGLVLAVTWLVEPHTTTLGLPRGATWQAVTADLSEAWRRFAVVKAPTPSLRGFVLAAVTAGWVAAAAADLFAFRLRARFEAVAPSFTIVVFASILATDRLRVGAAAAYLGAVVVFLLVSEVARRTGGGAWFGGRGRDGGLALLRRGGAMAAAALAVAVVAGPVLPGATAPGVLGWRGDDRNSSRSRVTVSPLVDIRGRLVDQTDVELFTVAATAPSYWRLTSLDRFDGTIWSSVGTYQPTRGRLPAGATSRGVEEPLVQQFSIGPLSSIWLPAAFRPERVDGVGGIRFDRRSASLLTQEASSDGLDYVVASAVPRFTAAELATAGEAVPDEIAGDYLDLPDTFPRSVVATAREVTTGAAGPYEQARALQDWFRANFTYDTQISPGHSTDAIERFLASRRGYCEQFAGTFAAMARAVGLPARVAVGFTPGTITADGRYHVAGRDAHAWPEVYLAGFGWVAFEPTPGRAVPGGGGYTGVQPQPVPDQPSATTVPTSVPAPGSPEEAPEDTGPPEDPEPLQPSAGERGPIERVGRTLALIALVNGLYLAAVAGGRWLLRQRRRRGAATPTEQVLVAWDEAEEALALAGTGRRPAETAGEFAARVGRSGHPPAVAARLSALAADVAAAGFSPTGSDPEAADRAGRAAAAVEADLRAAAGWRQRLAWAADPRPLGRALRAHLARRWARPAAGVGRPGRA
jgi:transglutaminase-like putative cysteine protease